MGRLKEHPGEFTLVEATEEWDRLDYKGRPLAFREAVRVRGQAFYRSGILYLSARLTTEVELECSRCLTPLRERVQLVESLQFEEEPPSGLAGVPLDGFSFEYGLKELELRPYFERIIASSLKSKPLCKPDCRGLCPTCGRDLNEGPCACAQERLVDPRLAKLKEFLA